METIQSKYLIIGGGLSGLTSAYYLEKQGETDITIIESRDRLGGRIHTKEGVDLGATWFQNHHEHVLQLLEDLQISKFPQYTKGKSVLVYNSMAPAHYFESDQRSPAASRIAGGSKTLVHRLAEKLQAAITLNTEVIGITERGNSLLVNTTKGTFETAHLITTIPPKITQRIDFSPELPYKVMRAMHETHTWMSNAIKVGMTFEKPFWREKGLSGTVIGQVGPVTELYDHNDAKEAHFALMGFVNEALRDVSPEVRKAKIMEHLQKYLGDEVQNYSTYEEKDWSQDRNTACDQLKSIYMSPQYGNPIFAQAYYNNKLFFSGAETSPVCGGYMDGAIFSGIRAAQYFLE